MRYLALAHNQRVGATTKANVLLNLGREDRLDRDGLRRLVRSINRYLGEPDTGTDAAAATGTDTATEGLRSIASRPAGAAWLLDGLWQALDVDPRCGRCWAGAGSPPMWSGCCSRWWRTAPSTRPPSSPPPSGPPMTSLSRACRAWTRIRRIGRWTC